MTDEAALEAAPDADLLVSPVCSASRAVYHLLSSGACGESAKGDTGRDDHTGRDTAAGSTADAGKLVGSAVDGADLAGGGSGVGVDEALQARDEAVEVVLRADAQAGSTGGACGARGVVLQSRGAGGLASGRNGAGREGRLTRGDGRMGQSTMQNGRDVISG